MGNRPWTREELDYLDRSWGMVCVDTIAEKIGRSSLAVKTRAYKEGLGRFTEAGDYVSLRQLELAMYGRTPGGYSHSKFQSLIRHRGLPFRWKRISSNRRVRVVRMEDFWAWAEKNRVFLDLSRLEAMSLGAEPDWVKEQRRTDYRCRQLQRTGKWTDEDISRLKMLAGQGRYSYQEISAELHRSTGSVHLQLRQLGMTDLVRKVSCHGRWTQEELDVLTCGIKHGWSYAMMADKIGKSDWNVRSKIYYLYFTADLDRVRALIGDGSFGDNLPTPSVWKAKKHRKFEAGITRDIRRLLQLLQGRRDDLKADYEEFFQRGMCAHWDSMAHICSRGSRDCDSCERFERKGGDSL